MLVSIAVDGGNTNTKMAVFHENDLVAVKTVVTNRSLIALQNIIRKYSPTHSILSNVGKPLIDLQNILKWKTQMLMLKSSTPVPISIRYRSKTLGTDRLALAVFAGKIFERQNALVVSTGTCITYDFVDSKKNYRGGAISPGLHMRLQSMHNFTAALPLVKIKSNVELVGTTTGNSMLSGAVIGAANEVNGFIEQYKHRFGNVKIILTGGDAAHLEPHLKFKIFARPYAGLEGLQHILQHNLGAL